jgi:hypothetical protein
MSPEFEPKMPELLLVAALHRLDERIDRRVGRGELPRRSRGWFGRQTDEYDRENQ